MTVLQQILSWCQNIPDWQSDTVRRLLKGKLTSSDCDDVYAIMKATKGLADASGRKALPLSENDIPTSTTIGNSVVLTAIRDLKNVNAIAEGKSLPISPEGITVIFGVNGSGKSGYSRVLKLACRARDQDEAILPNAAGNADGPPQAVFELAVEGDPQSLTWVGGTPAPTQLSAFSVFDSRCAYSYLRAENDFSFVPFGLHVFEDLAAVCRELSIRVDNEISSLSPNVSLFSHLAGETATGKLIQELSLKNARERLAKLTALTEEDTTRHAQLETALKTSNAKEQAAQHRMKVRLLERLAALAAEKMSVVEDEKVANLRTAAESYFSAKDAAELASKKFSNESGYLTGTGGGAWRELFDAATKFIKESDPDAEISKLQDDDKCPLCQEPLREGAVRFKAFEAFLRRETETVASDRREKLLAIYKPIKDCTISLGIDDLVREQLVGVDPEIAVEFESFQNALELRKSRIDLALSSKDWSTIQDIPPLPVTQGIVGKLTDKAIQLEKAADETARAALEKEFKELDARIKLNAAKSAVDDAIGKYETISKLNLCKTGLKTNSITAKATEVTESAVSEALADALEQKFKSLGVENLEVRPTSRSAKGKTLHRLKLKIAPSHQPDSILSEGEQRAIALGAFLAEAMVARPGGGLIFDDPVCSLDHRRREQVARTIVSEGATRQVIVFTHDIYFLLLLMEEAKNQSVKATSQSLRRTSQGFGVADPELPFEGRNTKSRIGALRAAHQIVAKLHRDGDEEEHRKATKEVYRNLRIAWERGVEEVLFRNVVLRFRKSIETTRLSEVVVDDSDYAEISAGMSKCSNHAHDGAVELGIAIPHPDELLADIDALEDWRKRTEARATGTKDKRRGK